MSAQVMTELASLNGHADFQLSAVPVIAPSDHIVTNGFSPPVDDGPDDGYVIRCFCDMNEDDGNTVLCETCNTWQHILCYYPNGNAPGEDDNHLCVVCDPRKFDKDGAVHRQAKRNFASLADRKVKKTASKSHKKKVKDPSAHTNGWLSGTDGHDRASGSPREQGPPTKRPKTNHKSSASTSTFAAGHSRKRAGSNALNGRSPTKSPRSDSPEGYNGEFYSPQFMRMDSAQYAETKDNSYASISVTNNLRNWLSDIEALQEINPNLTQNDVFQRWDRPIEALKVTRADVGRRSRVDADIVVNGQRPTYRWLALSSECDQSAYMGELNGHIGLIDDYIRDPKNRWAELRHPEPFVFFHDKLPIYVDCREEGSEMRFVGRSCQPNVKMAIIIHGTDFHFCFTSLRPIAAEEEVTVAWHIRDSHFETVRAMNEGRSVSPEDHHQMASWFTNVLANFGGCACSRAPGNGRCALHDFDLRNQERPAEQISGKQAKARRKKLLTQTSPSSTGHAVNSRAGSEAILQGENDDDTLETRSHSTKSRSQPSSRDATPMTVDGNIGLGLAMSERERKKLLQQEQLFQKMEEQQGGKKGKRHSASALATPNASSSKQLGLPDSSNPSPTSAAPSANRSRVNGATPKASNGSRSVPQPRPAMVTFATQTEDTAPATSSTPRKRRPNASHQHLFLKKIQAERLKRQERSARIISRSQTASPLTSKVEGAPSPVITSMPPPPRPVFDAEVPKPDPLQPTPAESKDVEMKDVAPVPVPQPNTEPLPEAEQHSEPSTARPNEEDVAMADPLEPTVQPPEPPWVDQAPPTPEKSPVTTRPAELHVTLPPIPSFTTTTAPDHAQAPTTPAEDTAASAASLAHTITSSPPQMPSTQSPAPLSITNPPMLSPQVQASVQPSPAKKKLSLSDYLSSKKKKDALAQAQAQKADDEPKSDPIEEEGMPLEKIQSQAMEAVDAPLPPKSTAEENVTTRDGEVKAETKSEDAVS